MSNHPAWHVLSGSCRRMSDVLLNARVGHAAAAAAARPTGDGCTASAAVQQQQHCLKDWKTTQYAYYATCENGRQCPRRRARWASIQGAAVQHQSRAGRGCQLNVGSSGQNDRTARAELGKDGSTRLRTSRDSRGRQ